MEDISEEMKLQKKIHKQMLNINERVSQLRCPEVSSYFCHHLSKFCRGNKGLSKASFTHVDAIRSFSSKTDEMLKVSKWNNRFLKRNLDNRELEKTTEYCMSRLRGGEIEPDVCEGELIWKLLSHLFKRNPQIKEDISDCILCSLLRKTLCPQHVSGERLFERSGVLITHHTNDHKCQRNSSDHSLESGDREMLLNLLKLLMRKTPATSGPRTSRKHSTQLNSSRLPRRAPNSSANRSCTTRQTISSQQDQLDTCGAGLLKPLVSKYLRRWFDPRNPNNDPNALTSDQEYKLYTYLLSSQVEEINRLSELELGRRIINPPTSALLSMVSRKQSIRADENLPTKKTPECKIPPQNTAPPCYSSTNALVTDETVDNTTRSPRSPNQYSVLNSPNISQISPRERRFSRRESSSNTPPMNVSQTYWPQEEIFNRFQASFLNALDKCYEPKRKA